MNLKAVEGIKKLREATTLREALSCGFPFNLADLRDVDALNKLGKEFNTVVKRSRVSGSYYAQRGGRLNVRDFRNTLAPELAEVTDIVCAHEIAAMTGEDGKLVDSFSILAEAQNPVTKNEDRSYHMDTPLPGAGRCIGRIHTAATQEKTRCIPDARIVEILDESSFRFLLDGPLDGTRYDTPNEGTTDVRAAMKSLIEYADDIPGERTKDFYQAAAEIKVKLLDASQELPLYTVNLMSGISLHAPPENLPHTRGFVRFIASEISPG